LRVVSLAARASHLFPPALVTGDASFAARVPRFLARPLVCGALLMSRLTALACNLALLGAIHRCKSAIFLGHVVLLPRRVPRFHSRGVLPNEPNQCN